MTEAGLISLVIGLPVVISAITGAIVGILNTRNNAAAIERSNKQIEKLTNDLEYTKRAARVQAELNRRDIVLMGESMSNVRSDNAKLALVFNSLYDEFEHVTGTKPPIDMRMLNEMRTIQYITGPLPHLEVR